MAVFHDFGIRKCLKHPTEEMQAAMAAMVVFVLLKCQPEYTNGSCANNIQIAQDLRCRSTLGSNCFQLKQVAGGQQLAVLPKPATHSVWFEFQAQQGNNWNNTGP